MMLELILSMTFSFVKQLNSFSDESTLPAFDLIGIPLLVSVPVKFCTILNNVLESC